MPHLPSVSHRLDPGLLAGSPPNMSMDFGSYVQATQVVCTLYDNRNSQCHAWDTGAAERASCEQPTQVDLKVEGGSKVDASRVTFHGHLVGQGQQHPFHHTSTMPPRKRARRSGMDNTPTPTPTPPPSQPPRTQRARTVATPGPAGGSRYPTRHRRRNIRGPDLAELEGGIVDLIPPSDDEEYEQWRAVRAVERAEVKREREEVSCGTATS